MMKKFLYIVYFLFPVAVYTIDQGGGGSGVFQKIWQQNANNMNQMLGGGQQHAQMLAGSQIVGEFVPCSVKFGGINSQLNFGGNQFARFQIGKRPTEGKDECPCPGTDSKGCPICSCSDQGVSTLKPKVQNQKTEKSSQSNVPYTVNPRLAHNSTLRILRTSPYHVTTVSSSVPVKPGPNYDQKVPTVIQERNNGQLGNSDMDKNRQLQSVDDSSTVVYLKSDDLFTYYGIIAGLSVVLLVVTIFAIVFFHKWRVSIETLKHEQNELYFAEKSLRLRMEKQTEDVLNAEHRSSTSSSSTRLSSTESCQDSVFTVDTPGSTDIQPSIGSPPYTGHMPVTPSAPLMTSGSNIFSYPPDACNHDYLELM